MLSMLTAFAKIVDQVGYAENVYCTQVTLLRDGMGEVGGKRERDEVGEIERRGDRRGERRWEGRRKRKEEEGEEERRKEGREEGREEGRVRRGEIKYLMPCYKHTGTHATHPPAHTHSHSIQLGRHGYHVW